MSAPIVVKPHTTDLNVIAFDDFLPALYRHATPGAHICIDLRGLSYIDLFSAICILHCCDDLVETHGCHVQLQLGSDGACSFLPRLGFLTSVPGHVDLVHEFTQARLQIEEAHRGTNAKFLEITPISSHQMIFDMLDQLIHIVRYNLGYRQNDALDLARAFSEISNNVLDHNPQGAHGFAAMQVCLGGTGKFLQFVVADRGLGIRKTLSCNPAYTDLRKDTEAIIASTGQGISEFGTDIGRGNGLHSLLDLVAQHGGQIHIRSGCGRVFWAPKGKGTFDFTVPHMPGVEIALRFPAKTKQSREA